MPTTSATIANNSVFWYPAIPKSKGLRRWRCTVSPRLEILDLAEPIDLQELKSEWLEALESVEPFVEYLPQGEIGCLYYNASQGIFVDPREAPDAAPHFGRPGGVLPRIIDS